jgi:hypothetical protein
MQFTCANCYANVRSCCPFCNLKLDEIPTHIEKNEDEFTKYVQREAVVFNEAAARELDQEQEVELELEQGLGQEAMMQFMITMMQNMLNPGGPALVPPPGFLELIGIVPPGAEGRQRAAEAVEEQEAAEENQTEWVFVQSPVECGACLETKTGAWVASCHPDGELKKGYCSECFPSIPVSTSHCLTCFKPVHAHAVHDKCNCVICLCTMKIRLLEPLASDPDLDVSDREMYTEQLATAQETLRIYRDEQMQYRARGLYRELFNF